MLSRILLLGAASCGILSGSAVPLVNPSFEEPAVVQTGTTITGWTSTGTDVQVVREAFVSTVNTTSAGSQFVRFSTQGDLDTLSQTVAGHSLGKGLYTLVFSVSDVFNDTNSPRPLTVKLLRADTGETLSSLVMAANQIPNANNLGDAATRKSATLFLPEGHAAIGQSLIIRFEAGTQGSFGQVAIDDVSLDYDPTATQPPLYTLNTSSLEARTDAVLPNQSGTAKDGTTYSVTRNGWLRNGQPWFPVSGEFHYLRYAEDEWDRELAKMKAAGIDIVATYVFWNHHESPQGTWNWSGRRNLRAFISLCAKHGLKVWLRVGPYVNAEALNGGIPSFANSGKRTDDPSYLALVDLYFQQIATQVDQMFVKDGGSIVGIQLENEFSSGNPVHITTLKQHAISKGLVAPYYSVTANSRFESGTVFPLQGSYTYRGWESGGGTSVTSGFIYGTDEWTANTDLGGTFYNTLEYPRGYCELGTGSPMRGTSRFLVEPKYVVAQAYDCVGRGANYLGYYMFHGGTQLSPWGDPSWGSSYDFQAPLGEFGQLRDSGRQYRRLHTFVREFEGELVPARTSRDPAQILDPSQTQRLRYIGRFAGDRGFLFLNNTQRNLALAQRNDVQIAIQTPAETLTVPSVPLSIPPGRSNVFPVRMDLAGIDLFWATVQPLAKLTNPGELPVFVFWMPDWTNRELALPAGTGVEIEQGSAASSIQAGRLLVHTSANIRTMLRLTRSGDSSPSVRVMLLTESDSLDAVVATVDGRERLLVSHNADISSIASALRFEGIAGDEVGLDIFPDVGLHPGSAWSPAGGANGWASFSQRLAAAPAPPQFVVAGSGLWTVSGNPADWTGLSHAHVRLPYAGGSARLVSAGAELTRDLYHGDSWLIDLKRYPAELAAGLNLEITGWDSGITGVSQPGVAMPALSTPLWQPRREIAWNDSNENALRDDWEMRYFGNLDQSSAADPDQDGLDNLREQELGTDPTSEDTDRDGTPDRAEVRLGLNPLDSASRFSASLRILPDRRCEVQWPSFPGTSFTIEYSQDLTEWTPLATSLPGAAGFSSYLDLPPVDAKNRFYRVSLLP